MTNPPDILPYDDDSFDPLSPQKPTPATLGADFAYIGKALTVPEFKAYLHSYNFGTVPPDTVVLHHTAVPTLAQWTTSEAGLSESAIHDKRLQQLGNIKNFYQNVQHWNAGPHIFIDDKYIYLFTPMYQVGIHAKWGNSFRSFGRLHYSIGIEMIGDYSKQVWPPAVARNVRGCVLSLHARLRTFELRYLYGDRATKPGMTGTGANQKCLHPERLAYGGIASHRDFNKPACPGAAITEEFYMSVITGKEQP